MIARHARLMAILALACGCGASPPAANHPEPIVAAPEPEASWESQLESVRSGSSTQIRLSSPVSLDQWRQLREGCEGLQVLNLPKTTVADAELEVLTSLTSLRHVVLAAPVGDDGMATLAGCPSLEIVNLPAAQFTDAGLARLAELPLLTLLRFGSPHVTDAGMEQLTSMPNLRFLHLLNVPITDAGLEPLKRIPLLESFYIDGGRCSDDGLSCLLKARPGLHLHVDQLHLAGDAHAHSHEPSRDGGEPAARR